MDQTFYTQQTVKSLLFITYDGIANSVFESQVLTILCKRKIADPRLKITIVAFESTPPDQKKITAIANQGIDIFILRKFPFAGRFSLLPARFQLRKLLITMQPDMIIARGPVAGYLALTTADRKTPITIQARGLLADEYRYIHAHQHSFFVRIVHRFREYLYRSLEKVVYATKKTTVSIEAVSKALTEFLISDFNAAPRKITIAHQDLPPKFGATEIAEWRSATRSQLGIPPTTKVFCYNGSAKPWQCPQETVNFFAEQYATNKETFLLVLSQDTVTFRELLSESGIPGHAYHIAHVPHECVYRYLAAADAGILFREPDIINWISRPTKVLEYQTIGLEIIHNNTVQILTEKKQL